MSDRVSLSFSQVDAILACMNFIAEHKRAAFTARIKQLFRNDIFEIAMPGRGRAGTYSVLNLLQLAIAVELLQAGMSPPFAAHAVTKNRIRLQQALIREGAHIVHRDPSERQRWRPDSDDDLFIVLTPEALRDLVAEGDRPEPGYISLFPSPMLDRSAIRGVGFKEANWRRLVINVSDVIRAIEETACDRFKFVSNPALGIDIMSDADEVLAVVMATYEATVAHLSEEQEARLSEVPFGEIVAVSIPPAAITFPEWIAIGKPIFMKNRSEILRLRKALPEKDVDTVVLVAERLSGTGIFRIDGNRLKITRLGIGVLHYVHYEPWRDYAEETLDVG
jgi:hypothetical protein